MNTLHWDCSVNLNALDSHIPNRWGIFLHLGNKKVLLASSETEMVYERKEYRERERIPLLTSLKKLQALNGYKMEYNLINGWFMSQISLPFFPKEQLILPKTQLVYFVWTGHPQWTFLTTFKCQWYILVSTDHPPPRISRQTISVI